MSEDYFEANRNLVRGEPFFGFGELWEQLAPDIEKQIRKFIDEGEYFGKFKCPGDGEEGIYIDYPDLGAPVKARIVIAQEKGQYTLASAYPAGAGLARELKIDATFDGADGLYGIVEASADEGPTLNFFVPDYETSPRKPDPWPEEDAYDRRLRTKRKEQRRSAPGDRERSVLRIPTRGVP